MESLKERWLFGKDISWLMDKGVDVPNVLAKMGSRAEHTSQDEIRAFCPDHKFYTGRDQSHPDWTVNVKTGYTFCFTEGRGSNLVRTVSRVFGCGLKDAARFMLNESADFDFGSLSIAATLQAASRIRSEQKERPAVMGLDVIAKEMENRYMSDRAYQFFIHPPGKKNPTNILPETVDKYWIFERTWGFYSDRVMIPFVLEGYVVGFCALDVLGKEEWLARHPSSSEDDYRKVRFPMNFVSGDYLFGYDDCEVGADFLIVSEGPREVMKLWQEGFTNSVAILGSYMSDRQMELISSIAPKEVVLMFDGDDAGAKTTKRISEKLSPLFSVRTCEVPRGLDPKNLARDDFEKMILSC